MKTTADFDARSLLFIPADAERFIAKGAERGADVIILDLEDGVAPASKARARAALAAAVKQLHAGGATVYVRVNNEPELLAGDVAAAVPAGRTALSCQRSNRRRSWKSSTPTWRGKSISRGDRSRWCA